MKKIFSLLFLFMSWHCFPAQVLSPVIKQHPGINYTKLSRIDSLMNGYISHNWLVGDVVLVVKDNQVVYYKGHGFADKDSKKPMQANAIFRIMSQTKAITSLAIMQLFEQGKLTLDQPVSDFIPEFKNPTRIKTFNAADSGYTTVPASREISIRDLLTHTSGLDYPEIGTDTMQAIYAKNHIPGGLGHIDANLLERMKALGKLPLLHNPGERFTYGLNCDVLGCLVEIISGETLEEYFSNHIFKPMGMNDACFNVPASKADRLATVYTENDQHQVIPWSPTFRNINPAYPLMHNTYFSGGAGMSSTAFDYAIFLQMLLNKGRYNGKQVLGRRTAELMLSPQLPEHMFGDDNFCLGFALTSKKSANLKMLSEGSFAWGGYFGTTYWADPKENLVCLIMTQQTPNSHYEYVDKLINIIYGSLK